MELILKEDVQNLGFKDEIVKVKNGYGRNFLIPKGMALKLHLVNNSIDEDYKEEIYDQFNKKHLTKEYSLNTQQKKSLSEIERGDTNFRVHVLQGTTGSGKTIVYFNAIKKKLNEVILIIRTNIILLDKSI